MKTFLYSLALAALSLGCQRGGGEEAWVFPRRVDEAGRVVLTEPQSMALGLERVAAEEGQLDVVITRFGKLLARPTESFRVTATVPGTLGMPRAALGDVVEAGAKLVDLEPSLGTAASADLRLRAQQIDGDLKTAEARLVALKSEAARMRGLVADKLATLAGRDRADAEVQAEEAHRAALEKAKAELAGNAPHTLRLVAPARGRLIAFDIEPGQAVQAGETLAQLLAPGPRWLDLAVPADEATGQSYHIQSAQDGVKLSLLHRGLTSDFDGLRRDRLLVEGADQAGLLVGATLAVEVSSPVLGFVLPEAALVRRGTESLVFIEGPALHFRAEPVTILGRSQGRVAVQGRISNGEAVVSVGAASLFAELQLATP